jgi:type IV secretion system protein VirD4
LPACTESKIDTRNSYWTQREIAGQFMPNPYHPPVVSVTVQTWRGKRTQPVITESVPDQFAHLPQYAGGTWSYVKGYRP